jgi:hypothetical protein
MSQRNGPYSLVVLVAIVAILPVTTGCHRTFKEPASQINMADPVTSGQLNSGFYTIESNTWRWTARKFSVMLKPPSGSGQRGAILRLHLYISAGQLQTLGPMTLSTNAGGYSLDPQTFSVAGPYVYSRDVPAPALDTNILPVKFCFDKAATPSDTDARQLAAVVTSVELQTK